MKAHPGGSPVTPEGHRFDTTVLQVVRDAQQTSLALALPPGCEAVPAAWAGTRLALEARGIRAEVHCFGTMKARSRHRLFFGDEAEAALIRDPGIEAWTEGARTPAATKVPGHDHWLRVRAAPQGRQQDHPVFGLAVGTRVALQVPPGATAVPHAAPRLRPGALDVQVLASHAHGLVLHMDARALRRLGAAPEDRWMLDIGGEQRPVTARRGLSASREAEVWARPETLLIDFEPHWLDEACTVTLLTPMQRHWKGRYPDWDRFTMPVRAPGGFVTIRRAEAP